MGAPCSKCSTPPTIQQGSARKCPCLFTRRYPDRLTSGLDRRRRQYGSMRPMPETTLTPDRLTPLATRVDAPRHVALVRVTHWLTTLCVVALLVSGFELVI